ncbi:MAG: hypothetical protein BME93_06500 [Methanosarcinales archaeon Met12]|nr:MAG: hypothetical protein BME93_06500 [Methanosarcinales archaeon Met12]
MVFRIRTSKTEIKHLIIAWLAISFAFAILFARDGGMILSPGFIQPMILALFTVGIAFLLHEMAHKIVAQKYGYWAEFRMSPTMLMFAILLAYFVGIVFAAPGAVMIVGQYITRSQNGKIAIAGPMTSILLVFLFLPLLWLGGFIAKIGIYGVIINILIALFNLLPFGPLDGRKVIKWSKSAYFFTVFVAFVMLGWIFIKVMPYVSL